MEAELLKLLKEYYWHERKGLAPENYNPVNMNSLSFYGFYEWLNRRATPPQAPEKMG